MADECDEVIFGETEIVYVTEKDLDEIFVVDESTVSVSDCVGVPGAPGKDGSIGPAGPQGEPGPKGDPGQDGVGAGLRSLDFNFASPSTSWLVVHNLNAYAIEVNTYESDGVTEKDSLPVFVDLNTVRLDWYYPETGLVRLLY